MTRALACWAVLAACSTPTAYKCTESSECVKGGVAGTCEAAGYCSFPDPACPSGRRFESNAGGGLANQCATGALLDAPLADAGRDATPDAPAVAIAFVQANAAAGGTATSIPLTFAPVAAHDTILVGVDDNSAGVADVTDSAGNTYLPVVGPITNGGLRMTIFAAFDVAGGADSITVTFTSAPTTFSEVYIHEYAGLVAFDAGASSQGTSAAADAMASGTAETHYANELVFGYGVTGAASTGTGFTTRSNFHSNITEDQIVSTAGIYQATATMIGGTSWTMLMATFRGF